MNVMFRYCFDLYYFREIMTSHPLKIARRFSSRRGVNYHVAQAGFRDYIDARCDSRDIPVKLRELSLAIQTIPVTSADAVLKRFQLHELDLFSRAQPFDCSENVKLFVRQSCRSTGGGFFSTAIRKKMAGQPPSCIR